MTAMAQTSPPAGRCDARTGGVRRSAAVRRLYLPYESASVRLRTVTAVSDILRRTATRFCPVSVYAHVSGSVRILAGKQVLLPPDSHTRNPGIRTRISG